MVLEPGQPCTLTIAEAMVMLRQGKLSPVELVDSVLRRIEQTEDNVHAYATVTAEAARSAAMEAEREIARGEWRGPLHGIPIALKDLYFTAGIPTEAGSKVLEGFVPEQDSGVATRLKAGGAILVGKTITHEFAYGQNVPPTRNAWNPKCAPGGSSAGSAVAVAVGSVLGAMGTDTGGSIRVPASWNGIVGFKPTFGRVTKSGVIPMSATMDHCGPLTKTVEDTALMMNVVAGRDSNDPTTLEVPVPDFTHELKKGVQSLRLGVERDYFFYANTAASVRQAVESAFLVLEELGAVLVEVKIPYLKYCTSAAMTLIVADTSSYHQKWLRTRTRDYEPGTRLMLELGELVLATDYLRALQARRHLKLAMAEIFEAYQLSALVTPTLPITTMPPDRLLLPLPDGGGETAFSAVLHNSAPFNLTGQPALTVPCGLSEDGLPIGLQIIGRPFEEPMVLRIGHAYESATVWHRERPPSS